MGGGANSDLWCQIIADASGRLVTRSATVEASSLGAAMCASVGAGWFPSMAVSAEAMSGKITRSFEPEQRKRAQYSELIEIYREIYPQLRATYGKLARFAARA